MVTVSFVHFIKNLPLPVSQAPASVALEDVVQHAYTVLASRWICAYLTSFMLAVARSFTRRYQVRGDCLLVRLSCAEWSRVVWRKLCESSLRASSREVVAKSDILAHGLCTMDVAFALPTLSLQSLQSVSHQKSASEPWTVPRIISVVVSCHQIYFSSCLLRSLRPSSNTHNILESAAQQHDQ